MTILEILEVHDDLYFNNQNNKFYCDCGLELGAKHKAYYVMDSAHRAHLVEVLDKHMQEREAKAKATGYTEAADALHSEARWQYERHTRHMPGAQIVAQRMSIMEEIMRDRAKELINGSE